MMGYPKTISQRIGTWEVVRCYQIRGRKLKLEKWAIKGWESQEEYTLYDTWKEVLNHMNNK
jgi:hypothetical protein